MEQDESPQKIYESVDQVWPSNDRWYDYTHQRIIRFVQSSLRHKLAASSVYLNAGSGGSVYDLAGICYHVDIAKNLIDRFPNYVVSSVESLPFPENKFDATICVGSVLNYCDAAKSIRELSRTLKPDGYLVLEFERSNTGELWGKGEYGKSVTIQKYKYMGHTHTLFLYSEGLIVRLLGEYNLKIIQRKRFHSLSALVNRITDNEERSGRFSRYDPLFSPISYLLAHNVIMLCKKEL